MEQDNGPASAASGAPSRAVLSGPSQQANTRLPPAAPPRLTIPPVVVPTAALEDLAALQAIDQTHNNGFEPLMERAAVSEWLSAGSSSKLSLPRYKSPQQVSDAGIAGPVWVITEPDSVARLIAALTPKEVAHNVSKELVDLRFTQQLGVRDHAPSSQESD